MTMPTTGAMSPTKVTRHVLRPRRHSIRHRQMHGVIAARTMGYKASSWIFRSRHYCLSAMSLLGLIVQMTLADYLLAIPIKQKGAIGLLLHMSYPTMITCRICALFQR